MRVSLGGSALRVITLIGEHLMRERPSAAVLFADEIAAVRLRLAAFPEAGNPTDRPDLRFVMLPSHPYKVFYRRIARDELRIMRVRHARRRLSTWT